MLKVRIKTLKGFLILLFLTSVLFVNIISLGGYIFFSIGAIKHRAEQYIISISKPVAFNLASLLKVNDRIQIEIILSNLLSNRYISSITLYDRDGYPIYRSNIYDSMDKTVDMEALKGVIEKKELIVVKQSRNLLKVVFPIYGREFYNSTLRDVNALLLINARLDLFIYDAESMIFTVFLVNILASMILSVIFIMLIERYVYNPLGRLKQLAEGITEGKYGEIGIEGRYEFKEIFESFNRMSRSLDFYTTRLEILNKSLIDEVKKRTAELERLKNRFKDIAESLGDILWETDAALCYSFCSNGIAQVLGYTPEEVLGRKMDFSFENYSGLEEIVKTEKSFNLKVVNITSTGEKVVLSISGKPFFNENGSLAGYRGVSRNITREEELRKNLERIQRIDSLGNLVSGIAHDFNNIINVIQNFASLVLKSLSDKVHAREYEFLKEIRKAALRGGALINKLLIFTRKSPTRKQVISPVDQIRAFKNFMTRTLGKNIDIKLVFDSVKPNIEMDPMEFDQILMNLSINARDAMPDGGKITIEVSSGEIGREIENMKIYPDLKPGKYCIVKFSDSGIGMNDVTLERIFEPFYTTKERGTGLGLSIVFAIVRQAGGGISVDSRVGAGTTLTLYFPEIEVDAGSEPGESPVSFRIEGEYKVLIIDDDIQSLRVMDEEFRLLGCETVKVVDCSSLPDSFLKRGRFDLFVIDLEMPGMTGEECIKRILKINRDARILVVSGYPGDERIEKAMKLGARAYLEKPFDSELLSAKLAEIYQAAGKGSP